MANLGTLDTKLLMAFDALMRERSVSRAAKAIAVTQSAMSQTLLRLRTLFDDPLFLRGPSGMEPTPVALSLAEPVATALHQLEAIMASRRVFVPAEAQQTFKIAMSDGSCIVSAPSVMRRVRKEAPKLTVHVMSAGPGDSYDKVLHGRADLGLGIFVDVPSQLASHALAEVPFHCLADKNNPKIKNGAMALEDFLAAPHLAITVSEEEGYFIDAVLKSINLKRNIALLLPHFLTIPAILKGTDMICVCATTMMGNLPDDYGLVVFPLPIEVPRPVFRMVWNPRRTLDPALAWFRDLVEEEVLAIARNFRDTQSAGARSKSPARRRSSM